MVASSKVSHQASTNPDKEGTETCDMCCSPIMSGKEDVLLCKGSCHMEIATVQELFLFFVHKFYSICLMSQELHHVVVSQLQAKITVLCEELLELHSDKEANQWSKVVIRSRPAHSRNAVQISQSMTLQKEKEPSPPSNDNNLTQASLKWTSSQPTVMSGSPR